MHPLTNTFDLVQRVQAGDREALETLASRYYDRVRRIVRARLGPQLRKRLETTDILGEVFAKAIEIFDRFEMRDEGSLLRWLGQIAEGRIRDEADKLKAQKRESDREVSLQGDTDDGRPAFELPAVGAHGPQTTAADREQHERLEAALDRLDAVYREVVIAREYEGLSWEAVAAVTGRPSPDAARMLFAKAKAELVALMATGGAGVEQE